MNRDYDPAMSIKADVYEWVNELESKGASAMSAYAQVAAYYGVSVERIVQLSGERAEEIMRERHQRRTDLNEEVNE